MNLDYLARLFDGEGTIGLYWTKGSPDNRYKSGRKSGSWVRVVGVSNTFKPILEEYQEKYGGRVLSKSKDPRSNKPGYEWVLGAKGDIIRFLEEIAPRLFEKRPQAFLLLECCKGNANPKDVESELRRLKRESS